MREHLETLAAHLERLDSGSADAKAIRWALAAIPTPTAQTGGMELLAALEALLGAFDIASDNFEEIEFNGVMCRPFEIKAVIRASIASAKVAEDDYKLPVDVAIGHIIFRKGIKLSTLVSRATAWWKACGEIDEPRALRAVLPALSPPAIGDGEMREILREQIYSRGKATEDRIKWYDESALAAMRRIAERAGASDLWRSFQHDEPGNIMEQPWDGQTVIIAVMPDGVVGEAYYDHERKDWNWANTHWTDATGDIIRYPTHWQPLPEPPVALHTDEKKGG